MPERDNCGSEGGYTMHRRRGEDACNLCKAAHSKYNRIGQHAADLRAKHGRCLAFHMSEGTPVCDRCLNRVCDLEQDQARYYLAAVMTWPDKQIA